MAPTRWLAVLAVTSAVWLVGGAGQADALPDGRKYELVSPSDKNGGDVLLENSRSRAAVDGDALQFASLVGFRDVQGTAISTEYIARRTPVGWLTHGITPRQDPLSGFQALDGPGDAVFEGEFSSDLSAGVVRANAFPQGDPNVSGVQNLFARRDLLAPGLGTFELVTESVVPIPPPWIGIGPPPAEIIAPTYKPFFSSASADFSHVIFESTLNLTQDTIDAGLPRERNDHKLYEWADGTVRYVGVLPEDEGGGIIRAVAGRGASGVFPFYTHDAISDDGSRIFFTAPETGQLYMRIDGSRTIRVNASEATVPAETSSPAEFGAATPDGAHVFFTSDEPLTDDDTGSRDLWRYDVEAPAGSRLTRLSIDQVPGDDHVPPVIGVLGVSDDGETAYFIARGALVPDMPVMNVTAPAIYQWRSGRTRYVGRLRPGFEAEEEMNGAARWNPTAKTSRVTADGRYALWITKEGDQLTRQDHGDCSGDPCDELYVFDADAAGGQGNVWCASCDPDGEPATASSRFITHVATGGSVRSSHLVRPLTEDGFVFFQTTERLLDEDRNDRSDVYEFDVDAGVLHLISSGRADASDSYFMDASASGDDVFFATRERLVGWDVDGSYDIYDARIGGGFAEPPTPRSGCVEDECQGALIPPPSARTPGSSLLRGTGNLERTGKKATRRCRRGKVRKRVRGRLRCVRKRVARRDGRRAVGVGEPRG